MLEYPQAPLSLQQSVETARPQICGPFPPRLHDKQQSPDFSQRRLLPFDGSLRYLVQLCPAFQLVPSMIFF